MTPSSYSERSGLGTVAADTALPIEPLTRTASVQERVYERLRQAIISGEIPARAELVSTQLATQLNVSRTPVREAIQRLVQEGLLERQETGVVRVRPVSRQEVVDLMAIRAELDAYSARQFVRRRGQPEIMDQIRAVAAEMEALGIEPSATGGQVALNEQFHELIRTGCGNRMVADLLRSAGSLTLRNLVVALQHRTSIEKNNAEHAEILAALEAGDAEWAANAARRHVESATLELLAKMDESETDIVASDDEHPGLGGLS